jgi:hypothetical protein
LLQNKPELSIINQILAQIYAVEIELLHIRKQPQLHTMLMTRLSLSTIGVPLGRILLGKPVLFCQILPILNLLAVVKCNCKAFNGRAKLITIL